MYQQIMKGLYVTVYLDMTSGPPSHPSIPQRSHHPGQFEFDERYWSEISYEAMDLVDKMLVVDPKRRITTEQVCLRSDSPASSSLFACRFCCIPGSRARRRCPITTSANPSP